MSNGMKDYYHRVVSNEGDDDDDDEGNKYRPLLRQILITSPAWMLLFATGFSFGAPTVFIPQIRKEKNSTEAISDEMASWLSSVFGYSSLPWIIVICYAITRLGRKIPFMFVSINTFVFNVILYFSTSNTQMLISEILQGMNHGANLTLTIIILSEYTSPKYRGVFLTIKSATFYWGVWCANAIGTFLHWKYIPLTAIVLILYNFVSFLWPESPHWLASEGRFEECARSYFWLMGKNESTIQELERLVNSQKECIKNRRTFDRHRIFEILTAKLFYKPTLVCIVMMLQYNFTGKIVCAMYAIDIIKRITGSESTAYYVMLLLDGVTVLGMYFGCFLTRVVKRRSLLMTSGTTSVIFLCILSLYLYLINLAFINESRFVTIGLLVGFSLSVSIGPVILLISTHAELTPLKYKSHCMAVAAISYNIVSGTLLKMSPYIFLAFGMHGTFLFYGLTSGSCLLILYFCLPETKDKTLQEIEDYFEGEEKKTCNSSLI
ncbi:facilitated trehalose transporter Tret1 isoform X1 [Bombyx mori]|uniref:facilitated trehalose transporter Tret1 isoform X1 n=2 Tax=Bombyx mori TaxID=7091 RepID=UPI000B3CAE99